LFFPHKLGAICFFFVNPCRPPKGTHPPFFKFPPPKPHTPPPRVFFFILSRRIMRPPPTPSYPPPQRNPGLFSANRSRSAVSASRRPPLPGTPHKYRSSVAAKASCSTGFQTRLVSQKMAECFLVALFLLPFLAARQDYVHSLPFSSHGLDVRESDSRNLLIVQSVLSFIGHVLADRPNLR